MRGIIRAIALFIFIITVCFIIGSAMVTIYNPQISDVATSDSATLDSATVDSVVITKPKVTIAATTIPNSTFATETVTTESTVALETTKPIIENRETIPAIEQTTEPEYTEEPSPDYDFLLDADNIDYDYIPQAISLSDSEREEIARIVMGEFGGGGFIGCALIAQCIRDAMDSYGYSAMDIRSAMQYYGYNYYPNEDCYEAIDWIFSGNAAVQHRILVMNNSPGGWHSTQNFVVYYQGVWFYDMWW